MDAWATRMISAPGIYDVAAHRRPRERGDPVGTMDILHPQNTESCITCDVLRYGSLASSLRTRKFSRSGLCPRYFHSLAKPALTARSHRFEQQIETGLCINVPEYGTRGFTLLELLVVIFIIGVLATFAVPALIDNRNRLLSDSADRLVLLINQARQEAVLSSRVWQLVVDPVADTYYFRKSIGSHFEKVIDRPFASPIKTPLVGFDKLVINGQQANSEGEVYLFPTGEQDTLSLYLTSGKLYHIVSMGPVGMAEVKVQ